MKRALLVLLALAPLAAAQEKALIRRLSDVVSVREGPAMAERVLYYFNPTVELVEGDELEQGSGGHSEITLGGEGLLILYANAHVNMDKLAAEGDVLSFATLTRVECWTGDRPLQLLLPGGTTCDLLAAHVTVSIEHGRLRVRNEGSTPVHVMSDLRLERDPPADVPADVPAGEMQLVRGEEARFVLVAGEVELPGESVDLWGALPVRHTGDVELKPDGDQLRVRGPMGDLAEDANILTVRGVRTVPRPGLVVLNPRYQPLPAPPPVPETPEPAAEPAPTEPPAGDQPPPADDGVDPDAPAGDQPK